jgi:predicted nucleic acid-binding protein
MNKFILTDTCFWIGLVDPTDQFHSTSKAIVDLIANDNIIFPWPCLYETISTHLTRRRERLLYLEEIISKPNVILFQDNEYKEEALKQVFQFNRVSGFTYSLTDSVIREILKNINVKVNYLVTFNSSDFKDICDQRQIDIIDE